MFNGIKTRLIETTEMLVLCIHKLVLYARESAG